MVFAPDGSRIGGRVRTKLPPLPPTRGAGHGLVRREVQRLLRSRDWSWKDLSDRARAAGGKGLQVAFYMIRNGERVASAGMVDQMVAGFGSLTDEQIRRLHVAAALDAGYRIGG